ncbi:DUF397 domain-containing protein [Streptomyces mobaraensis]|uniref:DUF397 domain-containing protein n=1 Tax=Streptomyces mobaraensis TaxID=35621 RepID=A0A5N5W1W6_STRMB|nr:DUF397 domain-containing protein [Streptomyces mobaraensis]KAB7835781.1 DUF397 domain-containing protein [Streptomyces mobaraensis]
MRTARTTDTSDLNWRKSSHSGNGHECVEVSHDLIETDGLVPVRDSKTPSGPKVVFTQTAWSTFVRSGYARVIPA